MDLRLFRRAVAWIASIVVVAGASAAAQSTETDLWSFGSVYSTDDGPNGAPVVDAYGNLFGSTQFGGAHNEGYVWEYTAQGQFIDLHDFSGPDGANPIGSLAVDGQGNVYGSTKNGGANSVGAVYEVSASGQFSLLGSMDAFSTGYNPTSGVVIDANGNLFGANFGVVSSNPYSISSLWELPKGGTLKAVAEFNQDGPAGYYPINNLFVDASGNVYGLTEFDSLYNGWGTIWKWSSANGLSLVYALQTNDVGPNQVWPNGVAADADGNVYAILPGSGANSAGQLAMFPVNGGQLDLYDFVDGDGQANGTRMRVALDAGNNLYGLSPGLVSLDAPGSAWELDTRGNFRTLFTFGNTPSGSYFPYDGPTIDSNGTIYGVTGAGGTYGFGTLWSYTPAKVASLSLSPTTVVGGNGATAKVTINAVQTSDTTLQVVWNGAGNATAQTSVTVPAGQTSATFPITTQAVATNQTITFGAVGGGDENFAVASLTVTTPTVTKVAVSPTTVIGGASTTGTVTISSPAPASGLTLTLTGEYAFAAVPATLTIPSGQTSGTFTVTTKPVATSSTTTILATYGTSHTTANLTVSPPTLVSISLTNPSLVGGNSTTGKVTIGSAAPAAGLVVSLLAGSSSVTVPTSVTIPSGATSASFSISTKAVTATQNVTLKAGENGQAVTTPLTLTHS